MYLTKIKKTLDTIAPEKSWTSEGIYTVFFVEVALPYLNINFLTGSIRPVSPDHRNSSEQKGFRKSPDIKKMSGKRSI
jgi:hypothetical protein